MLRDKHAIILDYKFGKENPHYNQQVTQYMQLLHDMGYSTEGWLAYVELDKLERVEDL